MNMTPEEQLWWHPPGQCCDPIRHADGAINYEVRAAEFVVEGGCPEEVAEHYARLPEALKRPV